MARRGRCGGSPEVLGQRPEQSRGEERHHATALTGRLTTEPVRAVTGAVEAAVQALRGLQELATGLGRAKVICRASHVLLRPNAVSQLLHSSRGERGQPPGSDAIAYRG